MPPTPEPARAQVESLRRKLLDLSLRNRMLNYKPSKRLGVTIVGEDSFNVHRILVEEGRRMSFVGKKDPPKGKPNPELSSFEDPVALAEARRAAEDEMDAFLENAAMPVDQMDTKLTTDDLESVLQPKLRAIQREAELANDELGINTLFLALGQLEWCDTDQKPLRAPLVYIPVTIDKQANGTVRLSHSGGDVGDNLPLRAKLAEFNLKLPELDDEQGLLAYFEQLESTIRSREDWRVMRNEICLGFFNYEKFTMYVDLGGEGWPEGRKPWDHPDLLAMLSGGYPLAESSIDDATFIDDVRSVRESHEVYDADSSQTLAMIRAASGLSIVIEGPPGTGKSQTITNIIAEAVAAGKTVLFVSAKRAALEVVKRRLEEADLGAMCLDLHDKLTNRREFYAEIKRTVGRAISIKDEEERVARLAALRDRLNSHDKAMNEPLAEFGTTPFSAMAILSSLPAETPEDLPARIPFESLKHLKAADARAALPTLGGLEKRLEAVGIPIEHPFWGAAIDYLDPARRLDITEALTKSEADLATAIDALQAASTALRIEAPKTADDVRVLRASAERALEAPPLDGVAIKSETWREEEPTVRQVINALRTRNGLRKKVSSEVSDAIWSADLASVEAAYNAHSAKWARFLIGDFRRAKSKLEGLLTPEAPADDPARAQLVRYVRSAQAAETTVVEHDATMRRLFGVQWHGLATDPEIIERLLSWVMGLMNDIAEGQLPPGLLDFFAGNTSDRDLLPLVAQAESSAEAAMESYAAAAGHLSFPAATRRSEPLQTLFEKMQLWGASLDRLPDFIAYGEARRQAVSHGLAPVVEIADKWPLASERLVESFQRSYYSGIVREAMQARPELKTFERQSQEAMIEEFRSLDDFKLRYNRAQVRLAHQRRLPTFDAAAGNLLLLKVQTELQRRHKPIRWIMARAGEAIQRIKPVFMMSPLSVAVHLPPEMPPFDLVVFDEASQVKPEDALSSIVRARQTIVVGDTRQMPPTSFFDRVADDEDLDEDEQSDLVSTARNLESILNLVSAAVMGKVRQPDLRWHYRSLHPALIQPSNEMFYDSRLVVFPSAGTEQAGSQIGVVLHHDPTTVYEAGARNRVNKKEAEQVADAVLNHVRSTPSDSLMVAAMNKPQADLIYDEVQKRERVDPAPFQVYRQRHPHEPLDVKNLENVQGDERDVVFISVTYGRDSAGVIRQQFGPLLRDGGERRLNVLITRARKRCEVFSNLTADDLRAEPGSAGVTSLKRYLNFAASGRIDVAVSTGHEEESPFEVEVASELRDRGYEVDPQVGTEGYRIDLAVRDPDRPGAYLLGIECDGASYHSARSARDRDKLRQRVLENRGWKIHRIWSWDWWQDRDGEIRRLIEVLQEAGQTQEEDEPTPEAETFVEETERETVSSLCRPYVETPVLKGTISPTDYVYEIVRQEGPITDELLKVRVRSATGATRATRNVRAWLDNLIHQGMVSGRIVQSGDAFHTPNAPVDTPRDWSTRPASERKTDYVPDVELKAAIRLVVDSSFGIEPDAAAKNAFNMMGFRRVTDEAVERGRALAEELVSENRLADRDGLLFPA
jgi:very-short-patch-repair endonuclease/DNA polymerase III delta prime subunit